MAAMLWAALSKGSRMPMSSSTTKFWMPISFAVARMPSQFRLPVPTGAEAQRMVSSVPVLAATMV